MKNDKNKNYVRDYGVYYKSDKEVWDRIPIDFDASMSVEEALARGLDIVGLDSYNEQYKNNPNIIAYTNVSREFDENGNENNVFYVYSVAPENKNKFFVWSKTDKNAIKIFENRDFKLDRNINANYRVGLKKLQALSKTNNSFDKKEFEESLKSLEINKKQFTEELYRKKYDTNLQIKNAIENNNAALVDNLYVKKFNNSSFEKTQLLNTKLKKLQMEMAGKPGWLLRYEAEKRKLDREKLDEFLAKHQVKKAEDRGTKTESGFIGISPVLKITDPEGNIRTNYGPFSLFMSDEQLYTDKYIFNPFMPFNNLLGEDLYDDFSKRPSILGRGLNSLNILSSAIEFIIPETTTGN